MIIIKNGIIVDGTGKKKYCGTIIIKKNKIVDILPPLSFHKKFSQYKVIDATGCIVAPGFIDIHSHADMNVFSSVSTNPKLLQGVTTEIVGNCGLSIFPYDKKWYKMWEGIWGKEKKFLSKDIKIKNVREYYDLIKEKNITQNVLTLIGYGSLRYHFTKIKNRQLSKKEFLDIKKQIIEFMEQGSCGISLGLVYPPCSFTTYEEIVSICKLVSKYNGYLAVHIRNEGNNVISAVKEVITIAKNADIPLQISHLKCYGKKNWYKFEQILEIIEKENKFIEITFDIYPYTAGSTTLVTLLPNWVKEGTPEKLIQRLKDRKIIKQLQREIQEETHNFENYIDELGYENIIVSYVNSPKYTTFIGKSLAEIAKVKSCSAFTTLCDILKEEKGGGEMLLMGISEENIRIAMKSKYCIFGTDALHGGRPHPRTFGTYPRIISRYIRDLKIISIEEGIKKMTSLPAKKVNLKTRGMIKKGFYADIIIFDLNSIKDKSTFSSPENFPEGIKYILVNGKIVFRTR